MQLLRRRRIELYYRHWHGWKFRRHCFPRLLWVLSVPLRKHCHSAPAFRPCRLGNFRRPKSGCWHCKRLAKAGKHYRSAQVYRPCKIDNCRRKKSAHWHCKILPYLPPLRKYFHFAQVLHPYRLGNFRRPKSRLSHCKRLAKAGKHYRSARGYRPCRIRNCRWKKSAHWRCRTLPYPVPLGKYCRSAQVLHPYMLGNFRRPKSRLSHCKRLAKAGKHYRSARGYHPCMLRNCRWKKSGLSHCRRLPFPLRKHFRCARACAIMSLFNQIMYRGFAPCRGCCPM